MRKSSLALVILSVVAVGAFAVVEVMTDHPPAPPVTPDAQAATVAAVPLVGADGKPTSLAALHGKWAIVFFGYMSCPDVCPTTLAYLSKEMEQLGASADQVQGVFVSVDPKRDAPAALGRYVRYFNDRFLAMTGTEENLRKLSHTVGAYFDYQKDPKSAAGYLVTHSSSFFVFDPSGRLVETLSPPQERGTVASALLRHVQAGAH